MRPLLLSIIFSFLLIVPAFAAEMTVYKDPNCGCCGNWVKHMEAAGHTVHTINTEGMDNIKTTLGVPEQLRSCHTTKVDGYLLEGHVPAADVEKLLSERPKARGLAVPGMPMGAPGMDMPGVSPDSYKVILFGDEQVQAYTHY